MVFYNFRDKIIQFDFYFNLYRLVKLHELCHILAFNSYVMYLARDDLLSCSSSPKYVVLFNSIIISLIFKIVFQQAMNRKIHFITSFFFNHSSLIKGATNNLACNGNHQKDIQYSKMHYKMPRNTLCCDCYGEKTDYNYFIKIE